MCLLSNARHWLGNLFWSSCSSRIRLCASFMLPTLREGLYFFAKVVFERRYSMRASRCEFSLSSGLFRGNIFNKKCISSNFLAFRIQKMQTKLVQLFSWWKLAVNHAYQQTEARATPLWWPHLVALCLHAQSILDGSFARVAERYLFFFVFDFSAPDLSIFMCPTFRALVLSKLLRVTERFTELDPGLKESAVLHSPASSFPETFSIFSFRTVALFTQAQECSWKLWRSIFTGLKSKRTGQNRICSKFKPHRS